MSLIQDALKRKREEEALLPPKETTPEPAPIAEPKFPLTEKAPKPPSNRIPLLLIALIVLLLVGLGLRKLWQTPSKPIAPKPLPTIGVENPVEPPEPPPPPVEPADNWPDLQLTGFASAGGRQRVVINGKMLSVGQHIAAVRVVEIGDGQVVIEYRDEQRTLYANDP